MKKTEMVRLMEDMLQLQKALLDQHVVCDHNEMPGTEVMTCHYCRGFRIKMEYLELALIPLMEMKVSERNAAWRIKLNRIAEAEKKIEINVHLIRCRREILYAEKTAWAEESDRVMTDALRENRLHGLRILQKGDVVDGDKQILRVSEVFSECRMTAPHQIVLANNGREYVTWFWNAQCPGFSTGHYFDIKSESEAMDDWIVRTARSRRADIAAKLG